MQKNYLKEHINKKNKKIVEKLNNLKKSCGEAISNEKQKEGSFFNSLFSKDSTIDANSTEELINKLIVRNFPLNQLRSNSIILSNEIEIATSNKVNYKSNENSKDLYEDIKRTI